MATAEAKLRVPEFVNESFIDFSKAENRKAMEEALKKVAGEFSREYPMWIGGQKVTTTEERTSTNPAQSAQGVGTFQHATAGRANQAGGAAQKYFDTRKRVPAEARVQCSF